MLRIVRNCLLIAGCFSAVCAADLSDFPVCTDPHNQTAPAVDADIIVWQDDRNGNNDVYAYGRTNPDDCSM